MNSRPLLQSTSPIIGIPVKGAAPIAIDGNRLRKWAKGLTINTVDVVRVEEPPCPKGRLGPVNAKRGVRITASVRSVPRASCVLHPIPAEAARVTLKSWAEKERERIARKRITGSITKDMRQAFKRAMFEDDGEGFIAVLCICKEGDLRTEKRGIPVAIPEWPEMQFALVKWGSLADDNVSFTITETLSGRKVGSGKTGEAALIAARLDLGTRSREKLANLAYEIALEAAAEMGGAQ